MRLPLIPVVILLVISVIIDWLVFRPVFRKMTSRIPLRVFDIASTLLNIALVTTIIFPKKIGEDAALVSITWLLFAFMSVFFPKIFATLLILAQRILAKFTKRQFRELIYTALGGAAVICGTMWWGAIFNRYNTNITEIDIPVKDLPSSFENFRIIQISDIHCGTYGNDTSFLSKVVNEINDLNPDIVVFSGDIVNRHSSELRPFIQTLSNIKAKFGTYSVMGNHDYGDYYQWASPQEKEADISALKQMQNNMGWNMLNNSHTFIHQECDSIALIGVENIGDPPFYTYGDLHVAYPKIKDNNTKILISHNPMHWVDSISDNADCNIALTLSGHTHAMQTEIFGISPAAFRYPTWGGLYTDNRGQYLYVNIGLGTVAFPMRVGATPEITVLTLKKL